MSEDEKILKHLKESAYISEIPASGTAEIWFKNKLVARRVGTNPLEK